MAPKKKKKDNPGNENTTKGPRKRTIIPNLPKEIIPMEIRCPFCDKVVLLDVDERSDCDMVDLFLEDLLEKFFQIIPCPHMIFGMNGADNNLYIAIHPRWQKKMRKVFKELLAEHWDDIDVHVPTAETDDENEDEANTKEQQIESVLDGLFSDFLDGTRVDDDNWYSLWHAPFDVDTIRATTHRLFPHLQLKSLTVTSNYIQASSDCYSRFASFMEYEMLFAKDKDSARSRPSRKRKPTGDNPDLSRREGSENGPEVSLKSSDEAMGQDDSAENI